MNTYVVTPQRAGVPKARIRAVDLFDLGAQIALHLAAHGLIQEGGYSAEIGDEYGAITQPGPRGPIRFTIEKETN